MSVLPPITAGARGSCITSQVSPAFPAGYLIGATGAFVPRLDG